MPETAIVIGGGIFGTSVADALAARDWSVQLVDRQGPGNDVQASAGLTRLIRYSHGEETWLADLAWRGLAGWRQLEDEMQASLLEETGLLWLLTEDASWEHASHRTLQELGIPVEMLSVADVRQLFPSVGGQDLSGGVYEPNAGVVRSSRAVRTLSQRAQLRGCELFIGPAVPKDDGVLIAGEFCNADIVVWACGAWLGELFPELLQLRVTKQDTLYLNAPDYWRGTGIPAWIDFAASVYGTADIGGFGAKVASDLEDEPFDPDTSQRVLSPAKTERVRAYLRRRFPDLADAAIKLWRVCQYAATPDEQWVIAPMPEYRHHWLVGGGSGHGFKHGPAFGEYVADVLTGVIAPDPRFALGRRAAGSTLRTKRDISAVSDG